MINSSTDDPNSGIVVYQEVLPGFGRLMSQGALSGALSSFLCIFVKVIILPHNYDGFLIAFLLAFLVFGAVFGLITALVLWFATHLIERRLGRTARLIVTSVVAVALTCIFSLLLAYAGQTYFDSQLIPMFMLIIVTVGLITGSHYHPGRAILQGMRSSPADQLWSVITIGFLLRVLYVFLCMQYLLGVILVVREKPPSSILLICLSLLAYCLINAVFCFDNAQSLWLVILAMLTNAALIFVLVYFWEGLFSARPVIIGYLALWFVFLLANRGGFTPSVSSIKEELRYYCIIN